MSTHWSGVPIRHIDDGPDQDRQTIGRKRSAASRKGSRPKSPTLNERMAQRADEDPARQQRSQKQDQHSARKKRSR